MFLRAFATLTIYSVLSPEQLSPEQLSPRLFIVEVFAYLVVPARRHGGLSPSQAVLSVIAAAHQKREFFIEQLYNSSLCDIH